MSTVQDLIQSSMRLLGAVASGESAASADLSDGLATLNQLVDSWANERLMIYSIARNLYPLTPSQQTYQMGTGAPDINAPRPVKIERAGIVVNTNPGQPFELPLELLTLNQWADIAVKAVPSSFPLQMYNDNAFPYCNLSFWPYPSGPCSVALYVWQALSQFVNLTDTVNMPNGYYRALRFNLAIDLAPEYGVTPSAIVAANALDSKAWIRNVNTRPLEMRCGPELVGRGRFNIITGSFQ